MKTSQIHAASWALVFYGIAVGGLMSLFGHGGWPEVPARVESVAATCIMHPSQAGPFEKSVEIDCADAEAFKRQHAEHEWILNERFAAVMLVPAGTSFVTAPLELHRVDGVAPRAGDILTVVQDPANPASVATAGQSGITFVMVVVGLILGTLALMAAVIRPRASKADMTRSLLKATRTLARANDQVEAARARRALLGEVPRNEGPVFGKR